MGNIARGSSARRTSGRSAGRTARRVVATPAGDALLVATGRGLAALAFLDATSEADALADLGFADATPLPRESRVESGADDGAARSLDAAEAWLARFFAGEPLPPAPALDLHGTDLQRRAWDALAGIPRGATTTYTDLARAVGRPDAVRAVASAIGANPVSLLLPCHRVVRRTGALGGYRWGLEVKRRLLALERAGS